MSSQNVDMYKIKPLYDFQPNIYLPSCMYKMKSIYDENNSVHISEDIASQDLANYQLQIIEKLEALKDSVLAFKRELKLGGDSNVSTEIKMHKSHKLKIPATHQDIVIKANPNYPPLGIWAFYNLLSPMAPVQLATYIHSSLTDLPKKVELLNQKKDILKTAVITFTIIWKEMEKDPEMIVDPINQGIIAGEVNIIRYLSRLLSYGYEDDVFTAAEADYWLQLIHSSLTHGSNKERNAALKSINSQLSKSNFLVGNQVSLVDIVLWSAIVQCNLSNTLPDNISKWWKNIQELSMFQTPLLVE